MRVLLALPLVLSAACGDNLPGPQDPNTDGADQSGASGDEQAVRYAPEICGTQSFGTLQVDAKDSVVRTVAYDQGAAVFMVPKAGGMLRAALIDGRGLVVGNPAGSKVRTDFSFTSVSASRVDDRFIVGLVAGGQTHLTAVRDDLGDYRELATADGELIGDTAVMHARNARVAVTGGGKGMFATSFDGAWASMGSHPISTSVPTSMTSAAYGLDAVVAWSTADECHLQRVAANVESVKPHACANVRVAVDFDQRGGWMVYERGDGVMLARIDANAVVHGLIGTETLLSPYARAPRIAFDGQTFWASYIDAQGEVRVGMLDDLGDFQSTAISGATPTDGYDLTTSLGTAWVYAIDGSTLGSTRICKTAQ